jgi:RimJ/RimL family protein N-acetyltransferase
MPPLPLPDPELADEALSLVIAGLDDDLAAKLLAPWALGKLRLQRVACDVDVDNAPSRSVARHAGFVVEDVPLAAVAGKGRTWRLVSYSLRPERLPR